MSVSGEDWIFILFPSAIGLLFFLISFVISSNSKKRNSRCTETTTGKVIQYWLPGNGQMMPVVEYTVGETSYKAKRRYRSTIKTVLGFPGVESKAWIDEKNRLHIKEGMYVNRSKLAEELWPVGTEMTVYYEPENPENCYVEEPVLARTVTLVLNILGCVFLSFGLLAAVLTLSGC